MPEKFTRDHKKSRLDDLYMLGVMTRLCPSYLNVRSFHVAKTRTRHVETTNDKYEFTLDGEGPWIKFKHTYEVDDQQASDEKYIHVFAYGPPGPEKGWTNDKVAEQFEYWLIEQVRNDTMVDFM